MRSLRLAVLCVLIGFSSAQAKTLLISDMDDTLKVANVQNILAAALHAFDDRTRFVGMAELYQDLAKYSQVEIAYVSRAPEFLLKGTHLRFLQNGGFPEGFYTGRKNEDLSGDIRGDGFKPAAIMALVQEVRPSKVILVGDNGERDPAVYDLVARELRSQGIEVHQFIRVLYAEAPTQDFVVPLMQDQVGFVTPVEIVLELERAGIVETSVADDMVAYLSRKLIKPEGQVSKDEVMFAYFQVCSDYFYDWKPHLNKNRYIPHLVEKLELNCGVDLLEGQ